MADQSSSIQRTIVVETDSETGSTEFAHAVAESLSRKDLVEDLTVYNTPRGAVIDEIEGRGLFDRAQSPYGAVIVTAWDEHVRLALSAEGAKREVAAYVANHYQEDFDESPEVRLRIRRALIKRDWDQVAHIYFHNHDREWYTIQPIRHGARDSFMSLQDEDVYREDLASAIARRKSKKAERDSEAIQEPMSEAPTPELEKRFRALIQ